MVRHTWLLDQIRMVHEASRGVYGARRVHAELTLGHGIRVGHGQVELVMARAGLRAFPVIAGVGHGTRHPPRWIWSSGSSAATHRTLSG